MNFTITKLPNELKLYGKPFFWLIKYTGFDHAAEIFIKKVVCEGKIIVTG